MYVFVRDRTWACGCLARLWLLSAPSMHPMLDPVCGAVPAQCASSTAVHGPCRAPPDKQRFTSSEMRVQCHKEVLLPRPSCLPAPTPQTHIVSGEPLTYNSLSDATKRLTAIKCVGWGGVGWCGVG